MHHQYWWELGYIQLFNCVSLGVAVRTIPALDALPAKVHVHALVQLAHI